MVTSEDNKSTCELMSYMEALGKILAKVVMDGHTINCSFAPVLYKYLLLSVNNGDGSNGNYNTSRNGRKNFYHTLLHYLH